MSPAAKVESGSKVTKGVSIRKAGADDAAAIAELLTELNQTVGVVGVPSPECFAPEHVKVSEKQAAARMKRMKSAETVMIAEVDGAPAGFTSLRMVPYLDQDTPYAEITQMHVRVEYRRRHVGAALIAAAEARAREAGATCVHIMTANNNVTAQAFYNAVGYEHICMEFEKFFGKDEAPDA